MNGKFQISILVIFTALLLASVIYNGIRQVSLLGWPEIILLLLILFIAIGSRITKLVISPKEISIEQDVENLLKDSQKIDRFIEEDQPAEKITDIVGDTLEQPHDTWSKLLLIRITLRRLLRKIADSRGISYAPTASISGMINTLHNKAIIDDFLAEQVEKIRSATFIVEWGAGEQPNMEIIKFTLENYGKVFESLKDRIRASKVKDV